PGAGLGSLIAENYAGPTKEEKWADGDGGLARHRKSRFADMVRDHTESIDDLLPAALAVAEAAVRFVDTQRRTANAPAG
ncbi:MAG: hypothetical protein HRU13_04830, partial [Phycisphaerales bacterium]|nr:hypothetical protein [Phycisphaerales bacterium]